MIHIAIDRQTGRSRGCGSVAMTDRQAVQAAIAGLHGTVHAAQPGAPPCVSSRSWW
jgi:hypothetical protein